MTRLDKLRLAAQMTVHNTVSYFNYGIATYKKPSRAKMMGFVRRVKRERVMATTPVEACQLLAAAKSTGKLEGDVAEVGVFNGATARLLAEALPNKPLHLFDTFEGLPAADVNLVPGEYCGSLESVTAYLGHLPQVKFYKGLFPEDRSHEVADKKFCFVHLDMDFYEGTLGAVEFFYPRMSQGGIILTHDYIILPGPTRAFDEFFADKPEPVIELSGGQALVMKTAA